MKKEKKGEGNSERISWLSLLLNWLPKWNFISFQFEKWNLINRRGERSLSPLNTFKWFLDLFLFLEIWEIWKREVVKWERIHCGMKSSWLKLCSSALLGSARSLALLQRSRNNNVFSLQLSLDEFHVVEDCKCGSGGVGYALVWFNLGISSRSHHGTSLWAPWHVGR